MIGSNGLLVVFDWLIDGPWWAVFLKCILLTPVALMIIAPLFESRWLPLHWSQQFLTFTIGDVFLAMFVASIVSFIRESAFVPISLWYHFVVLAACFGVAWFITRGEMKSAKAKTTNAYTERAVRSPTKLYHNYVLFGGYGYVMVLLVSEVVLQGRWSWWLLLVFAPFFVWLGILLLENHILKFLTRNGPLTIKDVAFLRSRHAHVNDWAPVWK